jgi:hypothetical protein
MDELKIQRDIIGVVLTRFIWDTTILPKEVKITSDFRGIYLKEDDYVFRTAYGNIPFAAGIHYWEIIADARSEHELKIGVSAFNLPN